MNRLEEQLHEIAQLDRAALQARWAALTGRPVPKVSTAMLQLALAYELQAKTLGGLSREARRILDGEREAKATSRTIRPGMQLAREHGGAMHVVTIGERGEIVWKDRQWRSLSEVARAITGTRWSGPAFFGLKDKRVAA